MSEAPRTDASEGGGSKKSVLSEVKDSDPPEKQAKKLRKAAKKLEKENNKLREELEHAKDKSRERLQQMNTLKKEAAALRKCVFRASAFSFLRIFFFLGTSYGAL